MKHIIIGAISLAIALTMVWMDIALAQGPTIDWEVVSGGGEPSAGGNITLRGTVGQTAIGPANSGDAVGVGSGYWYSTQSESLTELSLTKTVTPTLVAPGQTITYTLTFSNSSAYTATGVIITDIVPISITNLSVISSGVAITSTGSEDFAWNVADLAPAASGVITITGLVTTNISGVSTFTNTAVITTTSVDTDTTNNQSSAVVRVSPLIISEIMYNPASNDSYWEWVEIYNAGTTALDLTGYVLDDDDGSPLGGANIVAGLVPSGGTAILFDGGSFTAAVFKTAWGADVNAVAVSSWPTLNNPGDQIGLWVSYVDYTQGFNKALDEVNYGNGGTWPNDDGLASIHLVDLTKDNNTGSNWILSNNGASTPTFTGYQSAATGGGTTDNSGSDIGSPGPSSNLVITKVVNAGTVKPGDTVTYTLTFTNIGPHTASGIIITDIVPVSVTNLSTSDSGVVINQTITDILTYTWSVQDLDTDEGGVITITGVISPTLINGDNFTNTATIIGTTFDTNASNNSNQAGVVIEEQATDITLASFGTVQGSTGVTVTWETGTEIDNAGFNLYRATTEAGPYIKINPVVFPAKGDTVSGAGYSYLDTEATAESIYYYKLEDIDYHGISTFHGPVDTSPGLSGGVESLLYLPVILK